MCKKVLLYVFVSAISLLFSGVYSAQSQSYGLTVSGTVSDFDTGDPLIGALVIVVGTNNGTATDNYGQYLLTNVPPTGELRASYIGYEPQVRSVQSRTTIHFSLQEPSYIDGSDIYAEEE